MGDKQLLKLAAKAAHIELDDEHDEFGRLRIVENGVVLAAWNPLESDADAFRLAVAIGAYDCLTAADGKPRIRTWSGSELAKECAATRRAIVQAAAEKELQREVRMHRLQTMQ